MYFRSARIMLSFVTECSWLWERSRWPFAARMRVRGARPLPLLNHLLQSNVVTPCKYGRERPPLPCRGGSMIGVGDPALSAGALPVPIVIVHCVT